MLKKQTYEVSGKKTYSWVNEAHCGVVGAQAARDDGYFIWCGSPFVTEALEEKEAVALCDEYAAVVEALFADMRLKLEEMRGGK